MGWVVNATQANMAGTGIGTFSERGRDAILGGTPFDTQQSLVANQGFINGLWYDNNGSNGSTSYVEGLATRPPKSPSWINSNCIPPRASSQKYPRDFRFICLRSSAHCGYLIPRIRLLQLPPGAHPRQFSSDSVRVSTGTVGRSGRQRRAAIKHTPLSSRPFHCASSYQTR